MAIVLLLLVTPLLIAATWPWLCTFFQSSVVPFVRDKLGVEIGNLILDLVVFLDTKITPLRAMLQRAWGAFKRHILGIRTTYTKVGPTGATATTESYIHDDQRTYKVTEVRDLAWDDIPDDIRAAMIRERRTDGTVDELPVIEKRLHDRAAEHGLLDLVM